jgi:hypothetical protein
LVRGVLVGDVMPLRNGIARYGNLIKEMRMLKFLILWAMAEIILWTVVQWPFIDQRITNVRDRVLVVFGVVLWVWLLPPLIGG